MVSQDSLLVTLVNLVDRLPMPALPAKRGRGHPQVYPDRLFLKALVIMIVRCKLQNSVSYFWDSSMSYCLNCSAWRSVLDDREQVKKYDTEFSDVHNALDKHAFSMPMLLMPFRLFSLGIVQLSSMGMPWKSLGFLRKQTHSLAECPLWIMPVRLFLERTLVRVTLRKGKRLR